MSVPLQDVDRELDYSQLSVNTPAALLPLRLETKFGGAPGARALIVRIFPDDVHVDAHNPSVGEDEAAYAREYFDARDAATDAAVERALWEQFTRVVGDKRATYLASLGRAGIQPNQVSGERGWPTPVARALPQRFAVLCYDGNGARIKAVVTGVDATLDVRPIRVGPKFAEADPIEPGDDPTQLIPTWMSQVDGSGGAIEAGLAVRIPLTDAEYDDTHGQGVAKIIVVGLDHERGDGQGSVTLRDSATATAELGRLLEALHYTRGVDALAHGSPTRSTSRTASSFHRRDAGALFERGVPALLDGPAQDPSEGSDAGRLLSALGIAPGAPGHSVLATITAGDFKGDALTRAAHRLLWPATLGYYLRALLDPVAGWREREVLRAEFIEQVRPTGPLPTLRVGNQPYGILPIVGVSAYQPVLTTPSDPISAAEFPAHHAATDAVTQTPSLDSPPDWDAAQALTLLEGLLERWRAVAQSRVPHSSPDDRDPSGRLIEIMAHNPSMIRARRRAVLGHEVHTLIAEAAGWPSVATAQASATSQVDADLSTLGLFALFSSAPSPTISSTNPLCLSQEEEAPLVSTDSYSSTTALLGLLAMPVATLLDPALRAAALATGGLPSPPPLLVELAAASLAQAVRHAAQLIALRTGVLGASYPPQPSQIEGLASGNTPNSVRDADLAAL
ncbi:MAG: hypothetical protein AAGI01_11630, partial [Myxococcota bacterium]